MLSCLLLLTKVFRFNLLLLVVLVITKLQAVDYFIGTAYDEPTIPRGQPAYKSYKFTKLEWQLMGVRGQSLPRSSPSLPCPLRALSALSAVPVPMHPTTGLPPGSGFHTFPMVLSSLYGLFPLLSSVQCPLVLPHTPFVSPTSCQFAYCTFHTLYTFT